MVDLLFDGCILLDWKCGQPCPEIDSMLRFFSSKRFVVQLILVFVLFTLGTALGLGIPAALLLERQTNQQLNALVDQANRTTTALLESKTSQLDDMAELLAERPTFQQLVLDGEETSSLDQYLDNFLRNAVIEAIIVCGQQGVISAVGSLGADDLCDIQASDMFTDIPGEPWLISKVMIPSEALEGRYLLVGQSASSMLNEFKQQSGLDYLLFHKGELSTTSEIDTGRYAVTDIHVPVSLYQRLRLSIEDPTTDSHMAAPITLADDEGFNLVGLLNIETYTALNRQIRNTSLIILVVVCLLGALIAVLISRRISQPLTQLAQSAAAIREGDLTTRLESSSDIWEIDQLSNALEDARVSLKHSLDQLRTDKAWIESLHNAIVEGMLTLDENNRITYASEGIERMTGTGLSMVIGRPIDELFAPVAGEDLFTHQLPSQNQARRIPAFLKGEEVLLAVSGSQFLPSDAGNATRAFVIRDVTDEERVHRLIGEFMANITHEFRTPLSALAASVELLLDDLPGLSSSEVEELLHALNIGIIDLQSLIDNLIEAASIEGGRFRVNPQPVGFDVILAKAVATVNPIVKKYGLTLNLPPSKPSFLVLADVRRTCQALVNLLSNAIKHSPTDGQITIAILHLGKDVMVEVRDQGEGIDPERRWQLFNRFIPPTKADEPSQLGLGLGLSVVKAVIEAQNGEVGYKENTEGGAIFWFTLPIVTGTAA